MNRFQPIYDIASLCAQRGVHYAVLCPGSRCAPLTLAFARHPQIYQKTFSDERSAAFVALGISQQTKTPAILVCTSGSASYNFAPAVAEAFFSETPLLVFTADRPQEWIGQHDGQTIYQSGIFGRHVKKSFNLPADYDHPDAIWAINRMINEAINMSMQEPAGPVHINTPFREPLYPRADEVIGFSPVVRAMEEVPSAFELDAEQKRFLQERFSKYSRIAVVGGQTDYDSQLMASLTKLMTAHNLPVLGDIISNLHPVDGVVRHADVFLGHATEEVKKTLRPELLITYGKSVISKNLKIFLRKHAPVEHWHIQPSHDIADTFQSITHVIQAKPAAVFGFLGSLSRDQSFENQKLSNFSKLWEVEERRAMRAMDEFFPNKDFGEMELVRDLLQNLPEGCNLHLANSMSVRYANFIGLTALEKGIRVYANRGTSGIDGCTSTSVGHCLDNSTPNILITGDMAFFYDRNAFWHNYPLPNLRVVVLNNHGGIIFGLIDGPGNLPEASEFFITNQKLSAKKLCEEYDFDYLNLDSKRKVKNLLKDFFDFDGRTKVLELETKSDSNRMIFENFKKKIKKSYEA
jgi:2-succinyl-5-enolpyruvyl-6-hydroxy-3-cyclohexene-1-carboxylate synthase